MRIKICKSIAIQPPPPAAIKTPVPYRQADNSQTASVQPACHCRKRTSFHRHISYRENHSFQP